MPDADHRARSSCRGDLHAYPPIGAAFSLPVVAYDLAPNGLIWA